MNEEIEWVESLKKIDRLEALLREASLFLKDYLDFYDCISTPCDRSRLIKEKIDKELGDKK